MDFLPEDRSNEGEPERAEANQVGIWLTVSEAVTYCSKKGLHRTPKTVRKWAHRSHLDKDNAELEVRREDIETGFRWSIERNSLERKIFQEIEFEKRNQDALNRSGAPQVEPVLTGTSLISQENDSLHKGTLGQTVPRKFLPGEGDISDNSGKNEQDGFELVLSLRDQIRRLDEQVDFYKEELRDRRTSTKALAEVIQAFRLNAENQNNNQQSSRRHHDVRGSGSKETGDNETGTQTHDGV